MTARILRFPDRKANRGRVYCNPLDIYFPRLYVCNVTLTQKHIDEFIGGDTLATIGDEVTPGAYSHLTLDSDAADYHTGDVALDHITYLDKSKFAGEVCGEGSGSSALIRYHQPERMR